MKKQKQFPQLILGVSSGNFLVYIISFVVSVVLIGLGFIPCCSFRKWATLLSSVGSGSVSAVILAFFIEWSNNIYSNKIKKKIRSSIIEPIYRDLIQIICKEATIVEHENGYFKQNIQQKTLSEIIIELDKYYSEEKSRIPSAVNDYSVYNENKNEAFALRLQAVRFLGGLLNYAINDIYFNRSYNISYELFANHEIKTLRMIEINFSKVKNSNNYAEYIYNFSEFIAWIDCNDDKKSLFKNLNLIRKNGEDFLDEQGRKIILVE